MTQEGLERLFRAAAEGITAEVAAALETVPGATSVRDTNGETLLHVSARLGRPDIVKMMVSASADINAVDGGGFTAHHYAVVSGNTQIADFLRQNGAEPSVFDAACRGLATRIRELVAADPRLSNARDARGQTPLHHARDAETAEFLMQSGADVNARDVDGFTPLHAATWQRNVSVTAALLACSADVRARYLEGNEPLHEAVKVRNNGSVVMLLLQNGADVNAQDDYGVTPLHVAAEKGHLGMVSLLLSHGASPGARNEFGETPLHLAREHGHQKIAALLEGLGREGTELD